MCRVRDRPGQGPFHLGARRTAPPGSSLNLGHKNSNCALAVAPSGHATWGCPSVRALGDPYGISSP